jgi:uncharacterized coiled-coil protein SlyX
MSAEGFALGLLAGSHSSAQTGRAVVSFMTSLRNRRSQIDANALINAGLWMEQRIAQQDGHIADLNNAGLWMEQQLTQRDGHIAQQDTSINGLKREVAELRAHAKRVADHRDELLAWVALAQTELKRLRSIVEDNSQPIEPW